MMLEQLRKRCVSKVYLSTFWVEPCWTILNQLFDLFCQFPTQFDRNLEASPMQNGTTGALFFCSITLLEPAHNRARLCQLFSPEDTRGWLLEKCAPLWIWSSLPQPFEKSLAISVSPGLGYEGTLKSFANLRKMRYCSLRNCGNIDPSTLACLGDVNLVKKTRIVMQTHHSQQKKKWVAGKQIFRYTECLSGCSGVPPEQVSSCGKHWMEIGFNNEMASVPTELHPLSIYR